MSITKEKFEKYMRVRNSGITNMMDIVSVKQLTGFTEDEVFEVWNNYNKFKKEFSEDIKIEIGKCDNCEKSGDFRQFGKYHYCENCIDEVMRGN